ncbi:MAG: hypothetical protein FWE71_16185 [Nocardioidaceae bacterium]|nr:hypothetical protein [Nocardioidaceae bacterium]MCL2614746.1 hypothetical protein [Nocardioidaceae bacterium]
MTTTPHPAAPAPTPARKDAATTAVQVVVGLVGGLVFVLPLRMVLGTETDGSLYGWMLGGVAVAAVVAVLAQLIGAPKGAGVVTTACGVFMLLALVGVRICAATPDPPGDTAIALLVGLPAAALSALVAVAVVRRMPATVALAAGIAIAVLCFLVAAGLAIPAGQQLHDARDRAAQAALLERSSLSAYLPRFDNLPLLFDGITTQDGKAISYDLWGQPDGDQSLYFVEIDSPDPTLPYCTSTSAGPGDTCQGHGDYQVATDSQGVEAVVTDKLVATFPSGQPGTGGIPSVETIGKALADAEPVSWHQLVSTGH